MKVLLINPPWVIGDKLGVRAGSRWPHLKTVKEGKYLPFPFFLAYTGAHLQENGFDVLLIDAIAEGISDEDFFRRVIEFEPDLVIQEVSTPSMAVDLEYASKIKSHTNSDIAFCGAEVNIRDPDFLTEHDFVNYVLVGEYEQTALELAKCIDSSNDLKDVKGLIFRSKSDVIINSDRPLLADLDTLPWPLRNQLPMEKYEDRPGGIPAPSVQMIASRGCPYTCIFCVWPHLMYQGNSYRAREPVKVIDEMEHLIKIGFKSIYFDDDTFNIDKKRILNLCGEIKKRKLNVAWAAMARADNLDRETLTQMRSAGLAAIKFGVESGVQYLVDNVRKDLDLGDVKENVLLSKELGINVHLTFMFGLPGETKETIKKTIDFALELDPDSVQFSITIPFPGTTYFKDADKKNLISTKDWSDFDGNYSSVVRTEELSSDDLRKARENADRIWIKHCLVRKRYSHNSPIKLFKSCLREHGFMYTIRNTIDYLSCSKYRYYKNDE